MNTPDLTEYHFVVTAGGTPILMTPDRERAEDSATRCGDWVCTMYVDASSWKQMPNLKK